MKKLFLLIVSAFCMVGMYAQNDGGITPEMLTKIKAGYQNTPENKALRNAIIANDINKLAVNADNSTAFDDHFSNKVNSKAITDQKSSGRCWMFTGMNVMRSKAIVKHNLPADFQFSQAYTFFWDQLEKSNLFLQAVLDHRAKSMEDKHVEWLFKNPIGDGGQFTGVADLVTKYGIVPKDVMDDGKVIRATSSVIYTDPVGIDHTAETINSYEYDSHDQICKSIIIFNSDGVPDENTEVVIWTNEYYNDGNLKKVTRTLENNIPQSTLYYYWGDGNATLIRGINAAIRNTGIFFDLSGHAYSGTPTEKGIYILNGKKVVIE